MVNPKPDMATYAPIIKPNVEVFPDVTDPKKVEVVVLDTLS